MTRVSLCRRASKKHGAAMGGVHARVVVRCLVLLVVADAHERLGVRLVVKLGLRFARAAA